MAVKASATLTLSLMVDINSTCRYYKLQASTAAAPAVPTTLNPSGWSTTEPTYTEGSTNTLYVVDCTVFSNGTFLYTPVSKSSSYEASKTAYNKAVIAQNTANNIAVGGRNLIRGSKGPCLIDETISIPESQGGIVIGPVHGNNLMDEYISFLITPEYFEPNTEYTLSSEVEVNVGVITAITLQVMDVDNQHRCINVNIPIVSGKIEKTFTVTDSSYLYNTIFLYCGIEGQTDGKKVTFSHIKLEKGNKATDWTAAPEDLEDYVYVENGMINVGDPIGTHVVIDNDSMDIKKGNTVLSTFSDEGAIIGNQNNDHLVMDSNGMTLKDGIEQLLNCFSYTPFTTTLPEAAHNIGLAVVGTKVYLFGGQARNNFLDTINVFDTTNNTITTLPTTLPTAASDIGSAAVGTKVYLFGGYDNTKLDTINVFDTTNNTITTLPTTLPIAASDIGLAVVGTKVYLFGGGGNGYPNVSNLYLDTINVFDTTNNTITTLSTTLPIAADYIGSAVVGTKVYLFGGGGYGYSYPYLDTINVFDTTNNTITTLSTTLPTAAYNIGLAVVGTKVYLFGGYGNEGNRLNTINVFDTINNTITTLMTTLPTSTLGITSAVAGTKVYLFGGYGNGDNYLNTIILFDAVTELIYDSNYRLLLNMLDTKILINGQEQYQPQHFKLVGNTTGVTVELEKDSIYELHSSEYVTSSGAYYGHHVQSITVTPTGVLTRGNAFASTNAGYNSAYVNGSASTKPTFTMRCKAATYTCNISLKRIF